MALWSQSGSREYSWDPGYTPVEVKQVTPDAGPENLLVAWFKPRRLDALRSRVAKVSRKRLPRPLVVKFKSPRVRIVAIFDPFDHVQIRIREKSGRGKVKEVQLDNRF